MKLSRYILPTLKEDPSDAVVVSHRLMLRAGLVRKEAAGMYAYLPFGLKALQKVSAIVREEMNRAGALEFLMPELTVADLWRESGRWDVMGPEMIRIKDRNGTEYALGPTHEESFTNAVRSLVSSYRGLPVNVYQINTKFRDEIRPRFGVMRSKEFIMKDAYSFDLTEEGLNTSYETMRQTYRTIFKRCGLDTIPVQADTGNMGGSNSEEFMVSSEVGEEILLLCDGCSYRANQERAEYKRPSSLTEDVLPIEEVPTPDIKTIDDLAAFFKLPASRFLKSIIYSADGVPVMAVVPGDREINEVKLKNFLKAVSLELASDAVVQQVTGAPVGFAGPVNTGGVRMVFDLSIASVVNGITGANKKDVHFKGVNPVRDFAITDQADITSAENGDMCPVCGKPMRTTKGIEVGHIFKLGYKYTKKMNVSVLDEQGKEITPIMGCYGIGVTRTLAAIIEQHHDEFGIAWPMSIAPFQVQFVSITKTDAEASEADALYTLMQSEGIDVLYDDRNERPGVKFADADLTGAPIRVTMGKGFFEKGELEIKLRQSKDILKIQKNDLTKTLKKMIRDELARLSAD